MHVTGCVTYTEQFALLQEEVGPTWDQGFFRLYLVGNPAVCGPQVWSPSSPAPLSPVTPWGMWPAQGKWNSLCFSPVTVCMEGLCQLGS